MVLIWDNTQLYKEAQESYSKFKTAYKLVKESEKSNEPLENTTTEFIKRLCYDAFEIPYEIRNEINPRLNDELIEMMEKGFLKIKKEDINPFDPVKNF